MMFNCRIVVVAIIAIALSALTACDRTAERPQAQVFPTDAAMPAPPPVRTEAAGFRLVPLNGIEARIEPATFSDGKPVAKVTFAKKGEERRLLALEARPEGDPAAAKALEVRYRVTLAKGEAPRLALTIFEKGGMAWYRVGGDPLVVGELVNSAIGPAGRLALKPAMPALPIAAIHLMEGRLPLGTLRQAEFSKPASVEAAKPGAAEPTVAWGNVEKTWIGIVIDGPAEGTFEIGQARYTSEPYKPTKPLRVTGVGPGVWNASTDKAVKATLTTPNEGPDGEPCMKFEFRFPGQRHMYAIPSTPVLGGELEGYKSLRFTYKATLPPGIKGLLVTVGEHGGAQYYADPAPPPSAEWTTITMPFDKLRLATWTKDSNDKLDVDSIDRVMIGAHGQASGDGGPGVIYATGVEFVP